ncbi:galactosyltransferase-related protein [Campylobacter vulpis]|uniref:galactosyltransferase-related protein n=1 Tax=Campylobacter vulpis TaxID=1655500 RepID=UPI001BCC819B|nr:galactosyltransferase-related protein [Campylobacter vulpis]MBS4406777.1 capsular biosynthesis protein [Campylobacter vulpis]
MKYSIIIPVDLKLRPFDILKKVKLILQRADESTELIFGHNDRGSLYDKKLKKLIAPHKNAKLASKPFYKELICQALLRNEAFKLSSCEYIYLMDVDCLLDEEVNLSCVKELASGQSEFMFLPCFYLSPKGSRAVLKKSRQELFDAFVSYKKDLFISLAVPSACIFMKRADYIAIKGFDESFRGRGGEDFDFMLRLALFKKALTPSKDLMDNVFYKAPMLSSGFRKYLAHFCLPYFFEKRVIFHIHHGRNRLRSYFRRYKQNAQILEQKCYFKDENVSPYGKSLLELYESLCHKYEINLDTYSILFNDYRPKLFSLERFLLFLKRL